MFKRYDTGVWSAVWAIIEPHLPAAKPGGDQRNLIGIAATRLMLSRLAA